MRLAPAGLLVGIEGEQHGARTCDRSNLQAAILLKIPHRRSQPINANGFTEDLTTELARVPGLFVISRNAAFANKDTRLLEIAAAYMSMTLDPLYHGGKHSEITTCSRR